MIDKSLINEDYSFTIQDDLGNEIICDTLAVIEIEDEPIVIYTDYTLNEDNKFNLYVSKMIEDGDNFKLEEFKNYEGIEEIENTLEKIWKEMG